jgi:monoamine oxidase
MPDFDVVIVGAGAAGLIASRTLSKLGYKVVVVEARDRLGGRIYTLDDPLFTLPVEMGAEFIHGNLPLTLLLLNEYGVRYFPMEGAMWHYREGELHQTGSFMEGWEFLEQQLRALKEDMTIADFLKKFFNEDRYATLRNSVRGFVEGYDAADITRASTFALREEWLSDDDSQQYRVEGGYSRLIHSLAEDALQNGAVIHLASEVREINWKAGSVVTILSDQREISSAKIIVTAPLGVLQEGNIQFSPGIPEKNDAFQRMGFGPVTKIMIQFSDPFWEALPQKSDSGTMNKMSFLFSDLEIPTWWTQYPERAAMLTGWLAGTRANKYEKSSGVDIFSNAVHSLSTLFSMKESDLRGKVVAYRVANWLADPYAKGAYNYSAFSAEESFKRAAAPIENTLFFAGEAFYSGQPMGTVEAALTSGRDVATVIAGMK